MQKQLKSLLFGITFLCWLVGLQAQDIHFSQFYMSPLNLNPAMTGVMNCNVRVSGIYRSQWSSILRSNAYSTYSVSYDQRIPVGRYDYFGVGGTFWGDKAGESQFATIQGKLSGSFSKKMGGYRSRANYLVFGAEVGLSQRSLDFLALRYGLQHNGDGGFDPGLPSFESFNRDNYLFMDVSAGVLWFSTFDEDNNVYVGGSFSHLNGPNQSFNKEKFEKLYSKYTIHAGGEFMVSDRFGFVPGIVGFKQGPSFELNGGTSAKVVLSNRNNSYQAVLFGIWMRLANRYSGGILADAAILNARFDYENFNIGFSYDMNVSSLRPASNGFGAFEFAMTYKFCGPEKRNVYCPSF
ncbi:MAG: PorP/SprF family type IX secretion system membrane protein [Saprospiraceae bacterium]|nr:PorP/SprF family type IX secretion system membrane protein [Saprospiraceae bacterium]MBP7680026.1 PorP/SprF family type IX secretion system membrane protein [Saprospiraceae bacterium]